MGDKGVIDSKVGNFGFVQKNSSMVGSVIFPTVSNEQACLPLSVKDFDFKTSGIKANHETKKDQIKG